MKSINRIAAACIFAGALVANAQTQSASPAADAIPANKCEKPAGNAGVDPNYERQQRFQKKVEAYKDCVNAYAKDMARQAEAQFEAGRKYQEAGNAAIEEYNSYVLELNRQSAKKGDDKGASKPAVPEAGNKPGRY